LLWLLAIALAAPVRVGKNPNSSHVLGEFRLQAGQSSQALQLAETCLAERPGLIRCVDLRGRAYAQLGRCDEALVDLAVVRGAQKASWDVESAVAEAVCHMRLGETSRSLVAVDEAQLLGNLPPPAREQAAMIYARAGHSDHAWQLVDGFWRRPRDGSPPEVLSARVAWLLGENPEPWLQMSPKDHPWAQPLAVALALDSGRAADARALCQGEPAADPFSAAMCAEALRRTGSPEDALALLDRPWLVEQDAPLRNAIRARVLADLDRPIEARAELIRAGQGPSAVASAWYLDRDSSAWASVYTTWAYHRGPLDYLLVESP